MSDTTNEDLTAGTVDEVKARLASIDNEAELQRIEAAEKAGGNRVGVSDAIAARRAQLATPNQGTASTSTVTSRPPTQPDVAQRQDQQNDPNRVPSHVGDVPPSELAKLADLPTDVADPTVSPADPTQVVVIGGHEAAKTDPKDVGAFGMQLPPGGEVGGGNIAKTLDPPRDPSTANQPLTKERAALLSPVGRELAGFIGRPPAEWGLIGPGDVMRGHMLLLDLTTGEKVRGMDGHRVGPGKLYANLRNFPESLSTGDTIDQLLGRTSASAR